MSLNKYLFRADTTCSLGNTCLRILEQEIIIYWNVLPNTKLFSTLTSIPFLVVDECKHAYNNVYFDLVRCLLFASGREVTYICVFVNFKILVY